VFVENHTVAATSLISFLAASGVRPTSGSGGGGCRDLALLATGGEPGRQGQNRPRTRRDPRPFMLVRAVSTRC
jgi:hypothetical protein